MKLQEKKRKKYFALKKKRCCVKKSWVIISNSPLRGNFFFFFKKKAVGQFRTVQWLSSFVFFFFSLVWVIEEMYFSSQSNVSFWAKLNSKKFFPCCFIKKKQRWGKYVEMWLFLENKKKVGRILEKKTRKRIFYYY